ncbi:pyridoxal phosphate-dependent aminotransferase [Hyphococcus sp. DH-69]|uniref:pyridoxal phosphate-dependent aminotransferase n=1 Tax=Hyphococcus formosus TaxID=3143534 RepID=UPI00398AC4D9
MPSQTVRFADIATQLKEQGHHVVDMSAGRASEATDADICEAVKTALDEGDTHQTPARGTSRYRDAVAEKLERDNGMSYDPATEIQATLGCKNALVLGLSALIDPGDEVIIESPAFVSYAPTIELLGGVAKTVCLRPENNFRWTKDELSAAVTSRTKAILFCSPHNPLGVVHTQNDLEVIASVAREHDLMVFADEIYEAVTWGGRTHLPIASLPGMRERTIGMMGMTKSYSMGGWRVGYAYGPGQVIAKMSDIQAHMMTCASSIGQRAGISALSEHVTTKLKKTVWKEWERRCEFVSTALNGMSGIKCAMPEGGFYGWMNIDELEIASETFSNRLLKEHYVSTVPGKSFGPEWDHYVRITCVKSDVDIATGIERIAQFVEKLQRGL